MFLLSFERLYREHMWVVLPHSSCHINLSLPLPPASWSISVWITLIYNILTYSSSLSGKCYFGSRFKERIIVNHQGHIFNKRINNFPTSLFLACFRSFLKFTISYFWMSGISFARVSCFLLGLPTLAARCLHNSCDQCSVG